MTIPVFLGLCVLLLAGIAYVVGISTGTRNERTAGNVGCVFDWLWAIVAVVIVLAMMGAGLESLATGQPFDNPVSLVDTEYQDVWQSFWFGLFGVEQ